MPWAAVLSEDSVRKAIDLQVRSLWGLLPSAASASVLLADTIDRCSSAFGRQSSITRTWKLLPRATIDCTGMCWYSRLVMFPYSSGLPFWIRRHGAASDALSIHRRPAVTPDHPGQPWTGFGGLAREGKGTPTAYTGMVWSGFRPSDDEQKYGFLVPDNMFAVVGLNYVAEMAESLWSDMKLADRARRCDALVPLDACAGEADDPRPSPRVAFCRAACQSDIVRDCAVFRPRSRMAAEVDRGITEQAIVKHPVFGRIYAYEVPGPACHIWALVPAPAL